MTRTALIIGGGIAGPVTAMALQKAGFDATVYEAHPERTDGAGGGFTLAPNSLAALDALGLGDLVRPAGREVAAYVLQDWKGRPLAEFGNPPGVALRDHPAAGDAFAVYEAMRRPRVERIAKEAARKNNAKTAGPVGRALMGAAIKVFARLSNPEKAAWMLHYKIDWTALSIPGRLTRDIGRRAAGRAGR